MKTTLAILAAVAFAGCAVGYTTKTGTAFNATFAPGERDYKAVKDLAK